MATIRTVTRKLPLRVEFHHVDMMQIVHNSRYFIWFERGRLQLMEEFLPIKWAIEDEVASPVVVNHCEYLSPATVHDELILTTRHRLLEKWEGRLVFEHSISNAKSKMELCFGQTEVTLMNWAEQTLLKEIPALIWDRYQTLK